MTTIDLQTLGALAVSADSPDGTRHLGRGKPVALLAFLSAAPGRRASRERLATLLWSEGTSEQARQNLRQTIWYLRRRLGPCVNAADDFIELVSEATSDRERFLLAVREQRFSDALAAYGGEFIPDFAAPGASEFENWVDVERRRLRALLVGCCDTLVRQALGAGQFTTAVDVARRARDEAPLDLATWRLLLESLVAARDKVGCLSEVEHLEALIAAQDLEADDATRAALRSARSVASGAGDKGNGTAGREAARGGPADEQATLAPELIGREQEFRALLERWDSAKQGRGGAVLVTGVAGLGKSRLLADLHARLRASRARAIFIRANPGDRAVGGGFIAAVAESVAQRPGAAAISAESAAVLVALAPSLASSYPHARPDTATGEDALRRRVGALLDLLRVVSDETALALLVDDIHWTDPESRRVLDAVTARLDGGRTLVVLAARPPLDALGGFAALSRVDLPRFDIARVAEFLSRLGELPGEGWAGEFPAQLLAATRGVPLTLIEALQRLLEAGALHLSDHRWSSESPAQLARLLRDGMVLEARVRSLAPGARELLLLLATLGRPISPDAVSGAFVIDDPRLGELEHRGFLSRVDGRMQVAHDEIAAAALATATEHERRDAQARVARLLADEPESDLTLALAARHAVQADDLGLLRALTRRWVRRRRAEGEGAAVPELVRELVGSETPPALRRTLVAALPWYARPAVQVQRALAVAALGVLALSGWTAVRREPEPDLVLHFRTNEATPRLLRAEIPMMDQWKTGEPVHAKVVAPHDLPIPIQVVERGLARRLPDGSGWLGQGFFPDSGADEIFIATGDSEILRPVPARGDDGGASASPDGRYVVWASARWNPTTDRYNLGLYDRRTGTSRRLLVSEHFDAYPIWSPDGTRIAFHRNSFSETRPFQVCVVHADGSHVRCDWPGLQHSVYLSGWLDDRHLIVHDDDQRLLQSLDVETGALVRVAELQGPAYTSDPRVFVGSSDATTDGRSNILLARADRLGAHRPLVLDGVPVDASMILSAAPRATSYVDRVRLVTPANGVPVDLTYALRVEAFDSSGAVVVANAARFRSLDDSIAVVEGNVVRPKRVGLARVEVTLGGWRTDTGTVRIVPSTVRELIAEGWGEGWASRWRAFGEPRPRTGAGDGGVTLLPNGDGKYASGVYLDADLPVRDGVGVELRTSLPLTKLHQWQDLFVRIDHGSSGSELARWDHVTGFVPGPNRHACAIVFGGDGGNARVTLTLDAANRSRARMPTPPGTYSGQWMTVRLQLFPDGRCGMAIDGRALLMTSTPLELDAPARLIITGNSAETTIQVGRTEVWTGVKGGVDWSALAIHR